MDARTPLTVAIAKACTSPSYGNEPRLEFSERVKMAEHVIDVTPTMADAIIFMMAQKDHAAASNADADEYLHYSMLFAAAQARVNWFVEAR